MSSFDGGREPMEISLEMQRLAEEAVNAGRQLGAGDHYTIFALPEGFMDHFALVLWQANHDFPTDRRPDGFEMKLDINGQIGYLIEHSRLKDMPG